MINTNFIYINIIIIIIIHVVHILKMCHLISLMLFRCRNAWYLTTSSGISWTFCTTYRIFGCSRRFSFRYFHFLTWWWSTMFCAQCLLLYNIFILFLTASTVCECGWRKKKAERINKFLKEEEARVKIIIMNFIFFMIMKRKQSRKEVGKRKRRIRKQKTGGILKMKWKIQHRLMVIAHFYRMSEFDNFEQTN